MKTRKFDFDKELTRATAVNAMREALKLLRDPDADEFAANRVELMLDEAINRMHQS